MTANETQVGGSHYDNILQHWDFVPLMGLGYFEGQITKYVTRARLKNGIQDYDKAIHFVDKLYELTIDFQEAGVRLPRPADVLQQMGAGLTRMRRDALIEVYCKLHELTLHEASAIHSVCCWGTDSNLGDVRTSIHAARAMLLASKSIPAVPKENP